MGKSNPALAQSSRNITSIRRVLFRIEKVVREPAYIGWKMASQRRAASRCFRAFLAPLMAHTRQVACIIHVGRSGSTVLGDLLDQHPEVLWDGEIYKDPVCRRLHGIEAVIDHLQDRTKLARRHEIYGFEVKPFHLTRMGIALEDFVERMREANASLIVLQRRNYLRKIASSLMARKSSVWHRPNSGASDPRPKIRIPVSNLELDDRSDSLSGLLGYYDDVFAKLNEVLPVDRALWLTYEDHILASPMKAYALVGRTLKLRAFEPRVRYGRTNPEALSELVENYSELEEALTGTSYEWMLRSA